MVCACICVCEHAVMLIELGVVDYGCLGEYSMLHALLCNVSEDY